MISRHAKFHISYPVWRALYLGMLTSAISLKYKHARGKAKRTLLV